MQEGGYGSVYFETAVITLFMKHNQSIKEGTLPGNIFIYVMSIIACFITLYPLYYVFVLSLSDPLEAVTMKVYWWPKGFYLGSYKILFTDAKLWRAYANTIFYAVSNTLLMLITSVLAAYPLTYKRLFGKKVIHFFLLIPMYFSGGLIPTFLLITKLGLYSSPLSLILPQCFSIWYIILVKSYFGTLPESLREAARIDGANNYQILSSIYLPASKPILAVVSVYTIVGVWNSWFQASVYLPTETWQPLQLYLRRVLVEMTVDVTQGMGVEAAAEAAKRNLSNLQMRYAMIIFTTLPVIFVYPFFQKYFVKGVMLGSLKE